MKRLLSLFLILSVVGCATPVARHFPEVPEDLKQTCPALKEIDPDTTKLSDVIGVVSENYGSYQECKIHIDMWIEWYSTQKKIFESVK